MPNIYRSVMSSSSPPAVLQSKTVTAGTSDILVEPDVGYDGLSDVTVEPTPSQSKSATPTTSAQTITPDSGKLLSYVDIAPIPSQYKIPTNIMPISTPTSMTAGEAYSPTQNAYLIDGYSEVYPSNTYPAALYSGSMVKVSDNSGYAIQSYQSISQSAMASGAYFQSGIVKMPVSGYAYSSRPQMSETTLWTNSSPSSNFASQTVTLSDGISNYDYLKFTYKPSTSSSLSNSTIISTQDFISNCVDGAKHFFATMGGYSSTGASNAHGRNAFYVSNTSLRMGSCIMFNSASSNNAYMIPLTIKGLKL